MSHLYVIDPLDSLFFRDARPFSSGENSVGQESVFPPAPHTVVGAIRAQWAVQQGWSGRGSWNACKKNLLQALGGDGDQLNGVSFVGPELGAIKREGLERLYPVPAGLLGKQTAKGQPSSVVRLAPSEHSLQTDLGAVRLPVALTPPNDTVQGRKNLLGYLSQSGLNNYLHGGTPAQASDWHVTASGTVVSKEARVGNQIDPNTGRVIDGMLYSTNHLRLAEGVRLLMQVTTQQQELEPPRHLALGGEGRAATLELHNPDDSKLSSLPMERIRKGQYLVYVRTPILLAADKTSANPLPQVNQPFLDLPGQVVSACLYPAGRYGEWLQKKGQRHSQTRSVIPAGSVIFMQAPESHDKQTQALPLAVGERTSWGYGCIAIGQW